jgi:predicted alpha/beta hydrolase
MRTTTILSKSGKEIQLTIREPETIVKGVVQLNTGTCIPQKIYWKFAEFLTKNGYVTITYDYSDSSNYTSDIAHPAWLLDIESVTDFILQNYKNEKKYAVGHSSGAQFIGYSNNCNQFDKIFLVAASNGYIKNLSFPFRIVILLFWKIIVPYSIKKYGYMNNKILGSSGGFPKNIILELRSWCFQKDFFIPFFKQKNIPSYYHTITNPVKEYHLADDAIANRKSCEYILNLYTNAEKSIETLHAKDFGMKKFGHRGFYHASAEKVLLA